MVQGFIETGGMTVLRALETAEGGKEASSSVIAKSTKVIRFSA
jgi:hypothetical protein